MAPTEKSVYLSPIGEVDPLDVGLAPRLDTLEGKVLGILDDDMPNSAIILNTVAHRLQERFKLAGLEMRTRFQTKPGQAAREVSEKADFAIAANGM
ncbi:MAG: hypothetical protein HYX92_07205 [Chloroflexi bacterium]|nr:hypothetical protein [Chloroflexota bacterium]